MTTVISHQIHVTKEACRLILLTILRNLYIFFLSNFNNFTLCIVLLYDKLWLLYCVWIDSNRPASLIQPASSMELFHVQTTGTWLLAKPIFSVSLDLLDAVTKFHSRTAQ